MLMLQIDMGPYETLSKSITVSRYCNYSLKMLFENIWVKNSNFFSIKHNLFYSQPTYRIFEKENVYVKLKQ